MLKINETTYRELIQRYPQAKVLIEKYQSPYGNTCYRFKAHFKLPKDKRDLSKVHENLKKTWLAVGQASYNSYGQKGLVNGVPVAAHNVSVTMKGKRFKKTDFDRTLEKLKERLKALAELSTIRVET